VNARGVDFRASKLPFSIFCKKNAFVPRHKLFRRIGKKRDDWPKLTQTVALVVMDRVRKDSPMQERKVPAAKMPIKQPCSPLEGPCFFDGIK
jgi:hypothetical protein